MDTRTYQEISIGETACFSKTITETDIALYSAISGDFNPVHTNEEVAKETPFRSRIAHGGIPLSFAASIIGNQLPGPGTVFIGLTTKFKKPVYIGDTITCTAIVRKKIDRTKIVILGLNWKNQNNELVVNGECRVLPPKQKG